MNPNSSRNQISIWNSQLDPDTDPSWNWIPIYIQAGFGSSKNEMDIRPIPKVGYPATLIYGQPQGEWSIWRSGGITGSTAPVLSRQRVQCNAIYSLSYYPCSLRYLSIILYPIVCHYVFIVLSPLRVCSLLIITLNTAILDSMDYHINDEIQYIRVQLQCILATNVWIWTSNARQTYITSTLKA